MSKLIRIFLISGLFIILSNPSNAFFTKNNPSEIQSPPINISLSSQLSSSSYQTAAISFLPDLLDSELGFGNRDLNNDHNSVQNCKDYNKKSCSYNQSLGEVCPFDARRYKICHCNLTKYTISSDNCTYYGGNSSDFLVSGTICKDEGKGLKKYGTSCSCTSSRFPYMNDSSCPTDKVVDPASYCKTSDPAATRYQKCKCDIAKYNLTTKKDTTQGWECDKCSDDYGDHFECSARPCIDGSTTITSQADCSGNNLFKDSGYMSGGNKCGKCEVKSNCHFFKNFDGTLSIPDSACSWDLFGHTANVSIPSGKSYSSGWIRMWGNSSISGEFSVGTLTSGMVVSSSGPYNQSRTITYNDRVTINELIKTDPDVTTSVFKKGVCGNFRCEFWHAMPGSNSAQKIRDLSPGEAGCPVKASDCSDSCKSYFINSDGAISIPSGQCAIDLYGHTANVSPRDSSTYQPRGVEYDNFWVRMWGSTSVNGTLKTKNLMSGIVVSNGGYYKDPRTITFKGPVTISGILKTDTAVTTTRFEGGIYGNYTCENWTGTGGNGAKKLNDIQPGQNGCPCSQDRFIYDSSNCTGGTLTGTSCGGKYEDCKKDEGCTVGKIFFSDGTCSSTQESGKTITGVIMSMNPKLVIALPKYNTSFSQAKAGIAVSFISGITQHTANSAANDMSGKNNTSLIKTHSTNTGYTYNPIDGAVNYSLGSIKKGSWFLPSGGQAKLIGQNKSLINQGLTSAGGSTISDSDIYWTSSLTRYTGANPNTQNIFTYKVGENNISGFSGGHSNSYRIIAEFTPTSSPAP